MILCLVDYFTISDIILDIFLIVNKIVIFD